MQPTWESIRANYSVPQWFIDAKFGITMHWGLFSVAAYHNEWYEKYMYTTFADWHAQNFGPQDKFGYKDFIPLFTAKDFNADDMAELVRESGAKYFMPTVEHHDGFSLWNSATNPFNAANMGPHRDLVGEMAVATRKAGLRFGICSHNMEHYTFVNPTPGLKTDVDDPKYANLYWHDHSDARLQEFLEYWVKKNIELIDQYQPDVMWFDNGVNWRALDPLKMKVAAYYYNRALQWHKQVPGLFSDRALEVHPFSLYLPEDSPQTPERLVIAQWRQLCMASCVPDNPILAVRYEMGRLQVTRNDEHGKTVLYQGDEDVRGRGLDFRIIARWERTNKGTLDATLNGLESSAMRDLLFISPGRGIPGRPLIYFKTGLYIAH